MPRVRAYNSSEKITKLFRHALVEKGWSQKHLASICGITESQVSRVIKTPDKCCFGSVQTVAKKLGLDNIPIL